MRVAFLGLGAIGTPMAAHLASAHQLTVWNRTRARADAFASGHACTVAATPREAATGAEIVLTCLPTSGDVEALLEGPDGLLAGLAAGLPLSRLHLGGPGSHPPHRREARGARHRLR